MSFEEKVKELEMIIEKMSNDNISLLEAVQLYENALALIKECDSVLKEAKGKIEILETEE